MRSTIFISFIMLFIVGLIVAYPVGYYSSSETITITVDDKERVAESNSGRYLIFTEDEVYENSDSYLYLKFNSSEVYNKLEKGNTYKVKIAGWRVPFLSWYENILEIKKAKSNDQESS